MKQNPLGFHTKVNPITKCSMCSNEYNSTTRIPKFLNCGHTISEDCAKLISKDKGKKIRCPECKKVTSKYPNELATNIMILNLSNDEKYQYICNDHNCDIGFYCSHDETLFCKNCLYIHQSHSYLEISDIRMSSFIENKRKLIDAKENSLESSIKEYKNSLAHINSYIDQINLLVESHIHALKETEAKMVAEIHDGTAKCITQLQNLNEVIRITDLKITLATRFINLNEELSYVTNFKASFDKSSTVEKINWKSNDVNKESPPSLDNAQRLLDQLKSKIDYKDMIISKEFRLPVHGQFDIEIAILNILQEPKNSIKIAVDWNDFLTPITKHMTEESLPPFEFYSNHGMPKELNLAEILETGDIYTGQYNTLGQKHGRGVYTWSSGDQYIGYWKNNKRTGYGRLIKENGDTYEGNFVDDKFSGSGVYTFADKSKYYGFWNNGMMSGQGIFTWSDGASYNGSWIDGKQHGKGVMIDKEGNKTEGEWMMGDKL